MKKAKAKKIRLKMQHARRFKINNNHYKSPPPARIVYHMKEVMHLLGISRSSLWRAIKSGQLTVRQLGGRTIMLPADLEASLKRLPKGVHVRRKKKWKS